MTEDNIARLCMVCQHVLDDDEWVQKEIYEELHGKEVVYSHGVCEDQNCKRAFEAYCIGDFQNAMVLKNKRKND